MKSAVAVSKRLPVKPVVPLRYIALLPVGFVVPKRLPVKSAVPASRKLPLQLADYSVRRTEFPLAWVLKTLPVNCALVGCAVLPALVPPPTVMVA